MTPLTARYRTLVPALIALGFVATAQAGRAETRTERQTRAMTGAVPPCPIRRATAETITICGRTREAPYRIPQAIREERQPRQAGAATAWGTRTADADETARGGRPGSSAVDGAGGQTGQHQKIRREWELERQAIAARRDDPER